MSGFEVDYDGLARAARSLGSAADELRGTSTGAQPDAFGFPVLVHAVERFAAAIDDRLSSTSSMLAESAQALRETAGAYRASDDAAVDRIARTARTAPR